MNERIDRMLRQLDNAQDEAFWAGDERKFLEIHETIRAVEKEGGYDSRN